MMKSPMDRASFFTTLKRFLLALSLACAVGSPGHAQMLPKTSDIAEEVFPDGSIDLRFEMAFDAAPWRQWKAMVGDEPARLRAMMRHQFAVMTLEDFKLERDDMNRVAKLSMHSPVGPELRDDGSYQVPVDGYFRLVNGSGRTWYFSGNNPEGGNALNNVKVLLPANALNAYVANPNNVDQALVFALAPVPSPVRWLYWVGIPMIFLGSLSLLMGAVFRSNRVEVLPPVRRSLPPTLQPAERRPVIAEPRSSAPLATPPPLPTPSNAVPADEPVPRKPNLYNEPD